MRRSLSRSKDYAECRKDPHGIRYLQGTSFFGADGLEVDKEGNPLDRPDPIPQAPQEPSAPKKPHVKVVQEPEPAPSKKEADAPMICSTCGFEAPNQWAARAHLKVHK